MIEPAAKHASKGHLLPLEHPGILSEVLAFVGPGQIAFVGAVCTSFRAGALKVAPHRRAGYDEAGGDIGLDILPEMTSHEATFAAPSRLRWAIDSGFTLKTGNWRVQHWAGSHADVETLLVLHDTCGMQWTGSISTGAAESANLNKLRWLLDEQHCPQADDICDYAAIVCDTEALAWLKERGCMFTAKTCARAAMTADAIDAIAYLRNAGCEWDERTANIAARYGDLKLLQWLHKQGAPWDDEATADAACEGQLEALLWLKERGCPCDFQEIAVSAANGGSIAVLEWVKSSGEIAWDAALLSRALSAAAVNRNGLDACKVSLQHCTFGSVRVPSLMHAVARCIKQGTSTWRAIAPQSVGSYFILYLLVHHAFTISIA
jgi:hypothetical protein